MNIIGNNLFVTTEYSKLLVIFVLFVGFRSHFFLSGYFDEAGELIGLEFKLTGFKQTTILHDHCFIVKPFFPSPIYSLFFIYVLHQLSLSVYSNYAIWQYYFRLLS